MSALTSTTQVANLALAEIGAKRITSLDADSSPEAVACRLHFDHVRNVLLRSHPWAFAKTTAALSASTTTPVASTEWDTAWVIPGDILRLIRVVGSTADLPRNRYEIAGRYLHTRSLDTLQIVYVSNATPVAEWDDLFVDAMRYKLAAELCGDLAQDMARGDACLQKYLSMALPDAARVDAQAEASGENRTPAIAAAQSGLVAARFSRSGIPGYQPGPVTEEAETTTVDLDGDFESAL